MPYAFCSERQCVLATATITAARLRWRGETQQRLRNTAFCSSAAYMPHNLATANGMPLYSAAFFGDVLLCCVLTPDTFWFSC
jgi:hypothetical protein